MLLDSQIVYIPIDRRHAMARGETLPEFSRGAALFADVSGFTPLTEAFAQELGAQRGAEELTRYLNLVYDALIGVLHDFRGSVVGFAGDAITCWFEQDDGFRATACALAMQEAMVQFASIKTNSGQIHALAMKTTVATGAVRRFLVGNPSIQLIDVLSGRTVYRLAEAEHRADKGEVLVDEATVQALGDALELTEWRTDVDTNERFGVVKRLLINVPHTGWPPLASDALLQEQVQPWLLPAVYERLRAGGGDFLAELRPAVALFLRFGGINYDADEAASVQLDTFVRGVQQILERYEGVLLQLTVGDKGSYLYAAFGAPLAHEDDARRAVSAAMEMSALASLLDFLTPVQIGIARGRMRTGAYGSATRRTYGVLGDAANTAARLMQAAAPGQVLASADVQFATGDAFRWEALPPIHLKGKAMPIPIASLIGIGHRQSSRLRAPSYDLPMVGRANELALLQEKMNRAKSGHGEIAAIVADAGMGKSRLIAEAIRAAEALDFACFGGESESFRANTSYFVWQNIWRGLFDLDPVASDELQVVALTQALENLDSTLMPRLPLLGSFLNLSIEDNDLTRAFDAKLRKTSLEDLLSECLNRIAQRQPLLLVLEDCHWIDALSQDLLDALGRIVPELPIFIILAYRPSASDAAPVPRVNKLPNFTQITLLDFTADETADFISLKLDRLSDTPLPTQVKEAIVKRVLDRAEGNPFYVEELLNYIQFQNVNLHDEKALARLDLPASLHSLVLSRIDQLTESQQITLKVASVIGRLFNIDLLMGIHPESEDLQRMRNDLETLTRLDLTSLENSEPELVYLFKHAMMQQVAYESLTYATRAVLHEKLGQYIEYIYNSVEQRLDILALHYGRSDNSEKKREYLLKAGEAAQARYANEAAIDYYQQLLPLLGSEEQAAVMLNLGKVLELVGRWDAAGENFQQARELAKILNDSKLEAWCHVALGEHARKRGRYADALTWLNQAEAQFMSLGDQSGLAQVLHYQGTIADQQGNYQDAKSHYEDSLAIRRQLGDDANSASLLSNLAINARRQGNLMQAEQLHEESLAIRRRIGNRWAIAISLNNLGNLLLDLEKPVDAVTRFEEALLLMRQVGDRWMIGNFLNNFANAARVEADFARAKTLYRESLQIYREFGDKWALAYLFEDIGMLATKDGKFQAALRLLAASSALRQQIGSPLTPNEQEKLQKAITPARQSLPQEDQVAAEADGSAFSLEQAIEEALILVRA